MRITAAAALFTVLFIAAPARAATFTTAGAGTFTTARSDPSVTLLPDGRVLVAGGTNNSFVLSSAEVYDPSTDTWTRLGCPPGAGPSTACRNATIDIHWYPRTAVNPDGALFTMPATRDNFLFSLDLTAEAWTPHPIGPLPDGRLRGGPAVYYAPGRLLKAGTDNKSRFSASAVHAPVLGS